MKKVLVVGAGGREASIVSKLYSECVIYSVMPHINPTIEYFVNLSGGLFLIESASNSAIVADFAKQHNIDLAVVSSDEPLANGVVDALLEFGIKTVGPTKSGAQIEWDKGFAMELMQKHFPEVTPGYWTVRDITELDSAFKTICENSLPIVVKPQGLTGGKGVKVMGTHLADYDAAYEYAKELLHDKPNERVVLVEKVSGVEFTLMVLTDGATVLRPPATYDYPYRYDGDKGAGTGGMGAFSNNKETLPFMSQAHYDKCIEVANGILKALKEDNRHYNGVLNAGFFVTKDGLKFLEFNARFGDPECMNIMTVLDSSLLTLLEDIQSGSLNTQSAKFSNQASVVKYLVTPEYAVADGKKHTFNVDIDALNKMGIQTYFSSSERQGDSFVTVGNSRCVALAASSNNINNASDLIENGIQQCVTGCLEWRKDVGSQSYVDSLNKVLA